MTPGGMERIAKAEQQKLGLPDGIAFYSPFPFSGVNLEADRQAIADTEFLWRENYIRIGDGYLRTIWDKGDALYTAPSGLAVVSFFWFSIASVQYCAVFLSDGSAIQVTQSTGATKTIGGAGTFYTTGGILPACCQWGTQYLLISSNITANAYWVWDSKILYSAGSLGPTFDITSAGEDYTSAPTITIYGGEGSGATATATVVNGSVDQITLTNPGSGYQPGDIVQLQFSGGGTDNGAIVEAYLGGRSIEFVQVTAGGSGYTSPPTVSFTGGGGTGAAGTATLSGGAVYSVTLSSGGVNYSDSPVVGFSGGAGSGASARALITPVGVAGFTVVNGGTGFTSVPTLTITGGGGSGASGTAVLTGGVITSITGTSSGSGYTSAPAVELTTGLNNAASATATVMPYGISGSAIETYLNRVWLVAPYSAIDEVNNGTILMSAAQSLVDFATSDGGLIFVSNEPFLRDKYVNIKQSNGYLYPFGDSAVDVISNVQTTTSGTETTASFNYQNADPQTSLEWRDTAQYYGLSILFANETGAFGVYGGSVKKISKKITQIFENAIFPPTSGAVMPSAAVASLYTIKCFLLNMTVTDPTTGGKRTIMMGWDENEWFPVSQSLSLIYIGTQTVSSNYTAWGTDGNTLFPLFQKASSKLTKKLSTKLFGANSFPIFKQGLGFWLMAQDLSGDGITMSVQIDTEYMSTILETSPVSFNGQPQIGTDTEGVYGVTLGATLTSTSPDYVIRHLVLGYSNTWGGWGSPPDGLVNSISGGNQ